MTSYLVTGGAGFIGSHVTEALVARGEDVTVLDDLSSGSKTNLAAVADKIQFVQGDVRDRKLCADLAAGVDCIIHLAALTSVPASVDTPIAFHDVDATGTLNLLEGARQGGVRRFVFSSTCAVYGDPGSRTAREADGSAPASPYAAAKYAAESYCRAYRRTYGLSTVVLRYFNVFGPRQRPDLPFAAVVPAFIRALETGIEPVIYGTGEQTRDFVFVQDVAWANLLAACHPDPPSEVYNVASGRSVTILDVLTALSRAAGQKPEHRREPARPGDLLRSEASTDLAREDLGFEPRVPFDEGMERTFRWFAARGTDSPDRPRAWEKP
jgi:UDP-glucose 4-epimerase